jgi:hypothetical protein
MLNSVPWHPVDTLYSAFTAVCILERPNASSSIALDSELPNSRALQLLLIIIYLFSCPLRKNSLQCF